MELEEIRALRRALHQCPEPSGEEVRTKALLMDFLRTRTGLELHPCGEGFYAARREPGGTRPPVALRADYDALALPDGGAAHLCGHDGHAAALGGAIVDGGKFDWMAHADKFPGLCTPDDSYHGITYAERFGKEGAFITKATAQLMRDFGAMLSPQSAFILNLGLESLHIRMARHCENGQAVAEYLQNHPKIAWVRYSGLPGDPYYAVAQKYLPKGSCGVVSFGVKGGRQAAETFMRRLRLGAIATHVADARTCCLHPASSTHRQMNDAELEAAGVSADLVRLSVGLESREDLIADLEQALAAV